MSHKKNKHILSSIVIATLLIFSTHSTFAETENTKTKNIKAKKLDLKEIRKLIDSGNTQQALDQMEPFLEEHLGNSKFDYLYGMAAADNDEPVKAIFALERVVAQKPDFAAARLELARAMYKNNEIIKAKANFEIILASNPPKRTKQIIQQYLDKINNVKKPDNRNWMAQVAVTLGNDTNANSATSESEFLGFTLDPQSTKQASSFNEIKGLGLYNLSLSKNNNILFSGYYSIRSNPDASFTDSNRLGASATMSHKLGSFKANYGLSYGSVAIDGTASNSTVAVNASFGKKGKGLNDTSFYARFAQIRFDNSSQSNLDIDQIITGYTSTNGFFGSKTNSWTWSVILGSDLELNSSSTNSKDLLGGSFGFAFGKGKQLSFDTKMGTLVSAYKAPIVGVQRVDATINFGASANYKVSKNWKIVSELTAALNKSVVSVNDYEKAAVSAKVVWTY